jgi:hypothetical protein
MIEATNQSIYLATNSNFIALTIPGVEAVGVMKKKKRICRESLRHYYGNSINSPKLTEVPRAVIKVRRSPRLEGERFYCSTFYQNMTNLSHNMYSEASVHKYMQNIIQSQEEANK